MLGVVWIAMLGTGCTRLEMASPEGKVNSMARPVTIIANNAEGLAVQGADGEIAHWKASYYFAATIREQGLKAGEVLIP